MLIGLSVELVKGHGYNVMSVGLYKRLVSIHQ